MHKLRLQSVVFLKINQLMEGSSFFAGPLLDFCPAFFAEFGSNAIVYIFLKTSLW